MNRLILLAAILASSSAHAQKTSLARNVAAGLNFSVDNCFRNPVIARPRTYAEVSKFGFTTGMNIFFHPGSKTGFETGIQYSNKGFKTTKMALFYQTPDPSQPTTIETVYAYHYVGVPFKVKRIFKRGKASFQPGIGLMANYLLNAKEVNRFEYSDGANSKEVNATTSGFNRFDLTGLISAGIEYQLNSLVSLYAEPTFRYGLTKTRNAPVSERLWNTGLNFGFYYSLQ